MLQGATAGGPTGHQLFDLKRVAIETGCLLMSSFTCGLMSISTTLQRKGGVYLWAAVTFVLGAVFLSLEIGEFAGMVAQGAGPSRSAFLSAFFMLVGAHGLHVTAGLTWLAVMMVQVATRGSSPHDAAADALFRPVLARPGHHLGGAVHHRLPHGSRLMDRQGEAHTDGRDVAPGDDGGRAIAGVQSYLIGLALAVALTGASFWAVSTHLIWGPGVPIALAVLAIAQMGVHLVFFLHITTSPDNTNNVLALAFGVLIVTLVVAGSLWIMANLNANMAPMPTLQMQR